MKWLTPALVVLLSACAPLPPSLDAAVDAEVCQSDAGVTLRWSAPEADVVLLLDGDRPSVEQKSGEKWIAADRTKYLRLAALREDATTWSVSKVDGCVDSRDGGVGVLLLGDGSPLAAQALTIEGVETTSDVAGRFAVPAGPEPYSIVYGYDYGAGLSLRSTVMFEGLTVTSPTVRTEIGSAGRSAELIVRATSAVNASGHGYLTTVVARAGPWGNLRDFSAPEGRVSFPVFYWHGSASTKVTVTALRQYMKSWVTDDPFDRPVILGASAPVEVELRDGESAEVEVHVEPVEPDLRDLYLPSEFDNAVAIMGYGAPGDGPEIYSGRVRAQSKLPVVGREGYEQWGVSEPFPTDGDFERGRRGSGDFDVPREGAVIAPLYRAPRLLTTELPLAEPVLRWDMPQPCLCRAWLKQRFEEWVVYSVNPVDLGKAGIKNPGSYDVTLDCFPEFASVDDILTGQRGLEFAQGVGRRARVQTLGSLVIR